MLLVGFAFYLGFRVWVFVNVGLLWFGFCLFACLLNLVLVAYLFYGFVVDVLHWVCLVWLVGCRYAVLL